jgi:hypothetical protein
MDQVQQSGIALKNREQRYRIIPGVIVPGVTIASQRWGWAVRTIAGRFNCSRLCYRSSVRRAAISRECISDTLGGIRTEQRSKEGSEGEGYAHLGKVLS